MATPAPRCGSGNARGRVIGTLRVIVITLLPIVSGQDLELNQVLRGAAESLGRHDYAECQELARSAIDIDARVPEAHALLARALTYDSKYALAERALRRRATRDARVRPVRSARVPFLSSSRRVAVRADVLP